LIRPWKEEKKGKLFLHKFSPFAKRDSAQEAGEKIRTRVTGNYTKSREKKRFPRKSRQRKEL